MRIYDKNFLYYTHQGRPGRPGQPGQPGSIGNRVRQLNSVSCFVR